MPYARVVPAIRTPFGVNEFDYHIPESRDIRAGDVVLVPFRKNLIPALVIEIKETSPFAEKTLPLGEMYGDIRFPESLVRLLRALARQTFSSEPTILKSWLRDLPKNPKGHFPFASPVHDVISPSLGSVHQYWNLNPLTRLIRRAQEAAQQKKRVLILTPWKSRIAKIKQVLPQALVLSGETSKVDAFRAWTAFFFDPAALLVVTRVGAWLTPVADLVLLDEPENDDHKQDELAPRYDARRLASWAAQHAGTRVEMFGLTPPLAADVPASTIPLDVRVSIRHPRGRSLIPLIQADTLEIMRAYPGPRIILHPTKGLNAKIICRDCGWQAFCPRCEFGLRIEETKALCRRCGYRDEPPLLCPSCQGERLDKALPGIERLKLAWKKHEPLLSVEWRDATAEALDQPWPSRCLVIVVDGALLGGAVEDLRRKERASVMFRRIADQIASVDGALLVQTDEGQAANWTTWLTETGLASFQKEERKQRALFQYPPGIRLIKVLMTGSESDALIWKHRAEALLTFPWIALRGPFPVPYRSTSRMARQVLHLLAPADTKDDVLIEALKPLAKNVIIDLDPVAFFQ